MRRFETIRHRAAWLSCFWLLGSFLYSTPVTGLQVGNASPAEPVAVTRQVYAMGTRCTLSIFSKDRQTGLQRLEIFLRVLEDTERELSIWREDSVLSRLNHHPVGSPFVLSPVLCRLFGELFAWQEATGSAFDPAIGSLLEAWGVHSEGRLPSPAMLDRAREKAGMRYFNFEPSACRIVRQKEVAIDSGAFGKGEALDRIHTAALSGSSQLWLVDLGGQIMVQGRPPGGSWKVGIAHPKLRDRPYLTVELNSGSLSTSAGSERDRHVGGIRIAHHVDPRTGFPASFTGSVTVWHERAVIADILSTALYVMGPDEGLRWAEKRHVAACFFVPESEPAESEIKVRASTAFRRRFLVSEVSVRRICPRHLPF